MTPRSENPKEEGPFAWQARDACVQAGKLGVNAYAVYCALTHFQSAAASDHKRRFAASYDQLAEYLKCSTKTVQRCLADLQKARLLKIFSGANGSRRNIRNAFFLASISRDCESQRRDCESTLPKDCESLPPKDCESYLNKNKEQLDRAASSGSGSNKERRREPARPPLRGGSGPKEPTDENAPWLGEATPETTERYLRMKAALDAINAQ